MTKHFSKNQRGGVLIMSMVIFSMFLVVMIATVGYVNRQFKTGAHQEIADRAFETADVGIKYVLWLLNSKSKTPQELADLQGTITDPSGLNVIGDFQVTQAVSGDPGSEVVTFSSTSTDPGLPSRCRVVYATIQPQVYDDGVIEYKVTRWNTTLACKIL